MRHLVGHGHRRIAFIAGSPEDMAGDTGARFQAYRSALQEFGLPPDEHLVAYGRHITAGGYDAMRRIMDTGAPFTAILASNDESALGAMEALREAGIRVPQDVAIIGFDDRPESAVQEPALTSVAVPLFEMGYRAVEQLLRQIQGEPPPVGAGQGRDPSRAEGIVWLRTQRYAAGAPRRHKRTGRDIRSMGDAGHDRADFGWRNRIRARGDQDHCGDA